MLGATQDIGTDGVYVTTLPPGIRRSTSASRACAGTAARCSPRGPFVIVSGTLHDSTGSWPTAWMVVMLALGASVFLAGIYHGRVLPPGAKAVESKSFGDAMKTFGHAFVSFFQKKDVVRMIAFAFLYRFGYGLLDKMGPLFLIDSRANHGLGLSNQAVGGVYGTFGSGAFIVGSLLGGFIVSRYSLKKTLLMLCLCINVPNATFLFLSQAMPDSMTVITAVVIIEQLGWGIGAVGHMIYMMQQIAPGPYKTAHYTFATALMGACMMTHRRGQRLRPEGGRLPVVLHHRADRRRAVAARDAPGAVPPPRRHEAAGQGLAARRSGRAPVTPADWRPGPSR